LSTASAVALATPNGVGSIADTSGRLWSAVGILAPDIANTLTSALPAIAVRRDSEITSLSYVIAIVAQQHDLQAASRWLVESASDRS
jgi:hypothetical protein